MYPRGGKWEKNASLSSFTFSGHNRTMKAPSNVRHYPSHSDYLDRSHNGAGAPQKQKPADVQTKSEGTPSEKVELSSAKKKAPAPKKSDSSGPPTPPTVGAIASEIPVGAAKAIAEVAQNIDLVDSSEETPEESGPGVFFVSGFRLFGLSSSDGDGLQEMAKYSDEGQHYSWADEDEIFEKIQNKDKEGPLVLVGHSLGANAAVRIANKLNTAEHGFRSVDLLVTMDAFGLNNDIIPSNVQKNMNFIGHRNVFLNDGPNIARNSKTTEVMNELRDELHTKIDNSPDVQARIYQNIEEVISSAKNQLDSDSSPWRSQSPEFLDNSLGKEAARET